MPSEKIARLAQQLMFRIAAENQIDEQQKQLLKLFIAGKPFPITKNEAKRSLELNCERAIIDAQDRFLEELHIGDLSKKDLAEKLQAVRLLKKALDGKNVDNEAQRSLSFVKDILDIFDKLELPIELTREESKQILNKYRPIFIKALTKTCDALLKIQSNEEFHRTVETLHAPIQDQAASILDDQAPLALNKQQIEARQEHDARQAIAFQLTRFNLDEKLSEEEYGDFLKFRLEDINVKDDKGNTLLHVAARAGNPDILRLFQAHIKPPQRIPDEKAPVETTPWLQKNNAGLTPLEILFHNVRDGKQALEAEEHRVRAEKIQHVFANLRRELFQEANRAVFGYELFAAREKLRAVDRAMSSLATLSSTPANTLEKLEKDLATIEEKQQRNGYTFMRPFRAVQRLFSKQQLPNVRDIDEKLESKRVKPEKSAPLLKEEKVVIDGDAKIVHGGTRLHAVTETLERCRFQDWIHRASIDPNNSTSHELFLKDGKHNTPVDLLADELERQQNEKRMRIQLELQAAQIFYKVEKYLYKKLEEYAGKEEAGIFQMRILLINKAKKALFNMQVLSKKKMLEFAKDEVEELLTKDTIYKSRGSFQAKSDTYHLLRAQAQELEKQLHAMDAEEKEQPHQHLAAAAAA